MIRLQELHVQVRKEKCEQLQVGHNRPKLTLPDS